MAWDVTQPTDTTKIRNIGTVIRPNWVAIVDAESTFKPVGLNLDNRTPLVVANDPPAISEAAITYCKDDVAGDPQLFVIDQGSTITQLTGKGTIFAWARFAGNGAVGNQVIADNYNVSTINKTAIGLYTVSFTTNAPNANYSINFSVQMDDSFATGAITGFNSPLVGSFKIVTRSLSAVSGVDLSLLSFVVIGNS